MVLLPEIIALYSQDQQHNCPSDKNIVSIGLKVCQIIRIWFRETWIKPKL